MISLKSEISDYVNFDAEILNTKPDEIDWRDKVREECIRAVMNANESVP